MKKIKLTQGKYALVDNKDFEYLSQWKWHVNMAGYAVRGKTPHLYMHRLVNQTPKGFHTDHINHNKLDNRRSNLRTTTCSQNLMNSKISTINSSGHKGISLYKRHNVYHTYINVNKKRINLGHYKNIKDAIKVRKQAEEKYHAF